MTALQPNVPDSPNLWAQGSAEFKDYLHAFKRHEYRLAQQGKLTGWIKAR